MTWKKCFAFTMTCCSCPCIPVITDFIAFELGDVRFNIGLHDRLSGISKDPYRFMPHLGVDDIHAVAARLVDAGVEFIRQPEQESWGGWVATFRDPDGNTLQLLQLV